MSPLISDLPTSIDVILQKNQTPVSYIRSISYKLDLLMLNVDLDGVPQLEKLKSDFNFIMCS